MRNPLSIEAFADWCEKQPADKTYRFMNSQVCACGQYAAILGLTGDEWVTSAVNNETGFWRNANRKAAPLPWTFGALAQRLRSAS